MLKKYNFLLLFFVTAMMLSSFFIGCGGGGGTGIVEPQATFTATSAYSATPTPIASTTAGATVTAVASATAVFTVTEKPTVTSVPTSTSSSITGKVTSMFSSIAVAGATVTLGSESGTTDDQGNFKVKGTTGRMVIKMGGYYDYSFPVASSPLNLLLVGTDMNNISYSGYFIHSVSVRWLRVPKFLINSNIPAAQAAVIKSIVVDEISRVTGGYITVSESEISSTTATEPQEGEILIQQNDAVEKSYTELSFSGDEIVAAKVVFKSANIIDLDKYSWRTIRHELGHSIGFNHPFEVLGADNADLQVSVMNYFDKYQKYNFEFSPFDIKVGIRKYNRAAGSRIVNNTETDPDLPNVKHKKIIITKITLY